jgi:hypothetical protein
VADGTARGALRRADVREGGKIGVRERGVLVMGKRKRYTKTSQSQAAGLVVEDGYQQGEAGMLPRRTV